MKGLFLVMLLSACCAARTFTHVILIVQENRTPDNLFGTSAIPGADATCTGPQLSLSAGTDLPHSHAAFLANQAGNGKAGWKDCIGPQYVTPYTQMAMDYAFANRMFQTNQGPSFPAHQILFRGTASVTADQNGKFASENTLGPNVGCLSTLSRVIVIDPTTGVESGTVWPCFNGVPMLTTELEAAGLTWRYYTPSAVNIWAAPNSLAAICGKVVKIKCTGTDWANVVSPQTQVLNDIGNGNLANVSWVVPSGACSDRAGTNSGCGPSWVASIVNAVGQTAYWQDTVILVTWDDWGGWYDHVPPPANTSGWCDQDCYSFRVPLLVVCATCGPYVSNAPMDFNSLLAFTADNFSIQRLPYPSLGEFDRQMVGGAAKPFHNVPARRLTRRELADRGDPDGD